MDPSFHQAKICLEAYLYRGQQALKHLQNNQADEALEVLKWRQAAYHNFRAIDVKLYLQDKNYLNQDAFKRIWQDIQSLDQILEEKLQEQLDKQKTFLSKTREARAKIQKFHSGYQQGPAFQGLG
ncbi:MAG: hypothetical protein ACOH5I_17145 [Oligoflexus sp.]